MFHELLFPDDESQQDLFQQDSDDETHEDETDVELKWRMERYQREKWLEENQVSKCSRYYVSGEYQRTGDFFNS